MKNITSLSLITAAIFLVNPGLSVFAQTSPILTPIISQNTPQNIATIAQGITVKILVGDLNGSGVIVGKNGTKYTVITNAHVVNKNSTYRLQTPDGKTYPATLKQKGESLQGNDLAILEFQATASYPVAQFGEITKLREGDKVYSAGFPIEVDKLTLIGGEITYISPKPIKGGYQIAYNQETQQGMSGGALLNAEGKLIGIIGMSQGGVLEEAYHYLDNTAPSAELINQFRGYSFAVPVASLGDISDKIAQRGEPSTTTLVSQANYTGFVKEIDEIAAKITVRIEDPDGSNGSGVIIGKEGNTYYVATACHVVKLPGTGTDCLAEDLQKKVTLITPDQQSYIIPKNQVIIPNSSFDLAIVTFTSDKSYQVAELGNYQTQGQQWLFLSGFPGKDTKKQRHLTAGVVQGKYNSAFQTKNEFSLANGNELVYTNSSSGGMSGGPVLDREGRVVGIHTGAESDSFNDPEGKSKEVSLGYSLGIPITTLLGLVQKTKINPKVFKDTRIVAQKISDTEAQQIKAQLFRFEKPTQEANGLDWLNYGNELWRSFQYQEAVKAFDKAIELLEKEGNKETIAQAYYAKGLVFYDAREDQQALVTFQQATDKHPGFSKAWLYQGSILGGLQQYELALTAYQKAIDNSNETDFTLYTEQGVVLMELKRYPEALESYNQAIRLKDNHPWAYGNRGNLYYKQQKWNLALEDFNKVLELNPNDDLAYNNRGNLYSDQQKWDLALADYNKAIELNPNYAEAYNNRGVLYYKQQKWDLALADLNKAIDINPNLAEPYNGRGVIYAEQQKWDLALAYFNKAIYINPNLAEAYYNRGFLYYKQQKWDLALADFNKVLELNPNLALGYMSQGLVYLNQQKWDLALADFNKAIDINPNLAEAYNNRGLVYLNLQKWDLALADFNKAIDINPNLAEAYNGRGVVYLNLQKWDLALADFNKAIDINPNYANAYFGRGATYIGKGDTQKAIADLQKAAQLFQQQGNMAAYQQLMQILQQLGG